MSSVKVGGVSVSSGVGEGGGLAELSSWRGIPIAEWRKATCTTS